MNQALVALAKKYREKAEEMASKSFAATMYYNAAAEAVTILARQ
jgi:hypothetical protein